MVPSTLPTTAEEEQFGTVIIRKDAVAYIRFKEVKP